MNAEQLMARHNIERIVFVPASDLLPRAEYHAWPFGGFLAEHCGRGETIAAAVHDAVTRERKEAA